MNPLTKEESQQPVSKVGRAPKEPSRQRDDQTVVKASDGEHDRIKSNVSEAWTGEAPNRTRRQQLMELSSDFTRLRQCRTTLSVQDP